MRLGRERARALYAVCVGAFPLALVPWIAGSLGPTLLLPLAALPLAFPVIQLVRTRTDGPSLNQALANTGLLQLTFCVLLAGGLLRALAGRLNARRGAAVRVPDAAAHRLR